ncbi:MAG: hypothetical protein R2759_03420 [Bacteroidales bacterium]
MGSLHIDVISDGMLYKDVIVPISGDQGQGWKEAFAFFADFAGKEINVRFRGYTEWTNCATWQLTIFQYQTSPMFLIFQMSFGSRFIQIHP